MPPASSLGQIRIWLRRQDPIQSFRSAEARFDTGFEMLHPVLGP